MDKEVIMAIITSTIGCVVSILFENASQETSLRKRALDYFTFSENLSRHAGSRDDEELARFYQLKGVNDLENFPIPGVSQRQLSLSSDLLEDLSDVSFLVPY